MKPKTKMSSVAKGSIVVKSSTKAGVTVARGSAEANIVLSNAWACHSMIHLIDDVLVGTKG